MFSGRMESNAIRNQAVMLLLALHDPLIPANVMNISRHSASTILPYRTCFFTACCARITITRAT